MKNFFKNCIFCFNELTETERNGKGDHVVPDFLYGSFCIKDVCSACNTALGQSADYLALEDERIISAAFALNLPKLTAAILDRGKGTLVDETDGSEVPVRFKNGIPRVVPQKLADGMFASDEKDVPTHLINMMKRRPPPGVSEKDMEQIVREGIIPSYQTLKPGESVADQRLGIGLRKVPGKIRPELRITPNACLGLVAKIGYEMTIITSDPTRVDSMSSVLNALHAAAFGHAELDKTILMYPLDPYSPVNALPKGPKYHHQIVLYFEDVGRIVDIYFFGCVGFRLLVRSETSEARGPVKHEDGDIKMASVAMTFEPGHPREKFFFIKRVGCTDVEHYEGDGVL